MTEDYGTLQVLRFNRFDRSMTTDHNPKLTIIYDGFSFVLNRETVLLRQKMKYTQITIMQSSNTVDEKYQKSRSEFDACLSIPCLSV